MFERRTKTATGAKAFVVVSPKVWHDLPDSIRSIAILLPHFLKELENLSVQSGLYLLTRHLFTATHH